MQEGKSKTASLDTNTDFYIYVCVWISKMLPFKTVINSPDLTDILQMTGFFTFWPYGALLTSLTFDKRQGKSTETKLFTGNSLTLKSLKFWAISVRLWEKQSFKSRSDLKSVTELLHYMVLLESLVFTCVIHSTLIKSRHLEKHLQQELWWHSRHSTLKVQATGQGRIWTASEILQMNRHV